MANPFDRVYTAGATASDVAAEARNAAHYRMPRMRHGKTSILTGREEMDLIKDNLIAAADRVKSAGASVSPVEAEALETASREFNRAAHKTAFAEGKLGASIKGMFKSLFGAIGFDTSGIGERALNASEVNEAVIKAYKTKANMFERIVSKPFRVMSKPIIGIPVALAGLAYGVSSYLTGRAERRTEREAMEAMAQAQAQAAAMQAAQQPSYKNSVTPQDMAAMQARMEADGKGAPAFTSNVEASKAAASQAPVTSVA